MAKLKPGDSIPPFKIIDCEGETVTQEDLLGSPFILYFYPKDDTPGCTSEACDYRDHMEVFDDMDILVVGISPDTCESHKKFIEKHDLNFPLLCDEKLEVANKFGAIKGDGTSIERSTFLFDDEGVLQWNEQPVKVEGHVERVINAIDEIMA
jgi:peroxiredoxin Q/BCP